MLTPQVLFPRDATHSACPEHAVSSCLLTGPRSASLNTLAWHAAWATAMDGGTVFVLGLPASVNEPSLAFPTPEGMSSEQCASVLRRIQIRYVSDGLEACRVLARVHQAPAPVPALLILLGFHALFQGLDQPADVQLRTLALLREASLWCGRQLYPGRPDAAADVLLVDLTGRAVDRASSASPSSAEMHMFQHWIQAFFVVQSADASQEPDRWSLRVSQIRGSLDPRNLRIDYRVDKSLPPAKQYVDVCGYQTQSLAVR